MVLPNFLVLGAQRSGSTWLYQSLRRHPDIYMPEKKELEFFSYPERVEKYGIEGYSRKYFANVKDEKVVGEASPSYLWVANEYPQWCVRPLGFNKNIPKLVYDTLGPETKLIVSLRNPVRRAISGYVHHLNRGRLRNSTSVLDAGRFCGIVHIGFYFAHLTEWLQYFDRSNLFVLIFEEATRREQAAYSKVFQFLEVNPNRTNPAMTWQFNKNPSLIENESGVFVPNSSLANAPDSGKGDGHMTRIAGTNDIATLQNIYMNDVRMLSDFLEKDLVSLWFGKK